jgi:4a-hydroxytetrahydrobiopterin dehydratase
MEDLTNKKCRSCELGEVKLNPDDIQALLTHTPNWDVLDNHSISRHFEFKNFREALNFVNKVGAIAESEGHHPDVELGWGYVNIKLFTHAVDGLSENDFIMAAKINKLS